MLKIENKEAILYFDKATIDPYTRGGLEVSFYKPSSLKTMRIENLQDQWSDIVVTNRNDTTLFLMSKPIEVEGTVNEYQNIRLVFQSPHLWLQKINFFNWIEASKLKTVYLYALTK